MDRLTGLMLTTVVWGAEVVDVFQTVALPNVASLVQEIPVSLRAQSSYVIVTRPEDAAVIRPNPILDEIAQFIPVDVRETFTDEGRELWGGYGPMVINQERLIAEAGSRNLGVIFWGPDLLMSSGSIATIVSKVNEGYRVVIGPSARATTDSVLPVLRGRLKERGARSFAYDGISLAELLFRHWNPVNDLWIWNQTRSRFERTFMYYRVEYKAILMRYLQGPTIFAWPDARASSFRGFLDHHVPEVCVESADQIYVIRDCIEMMTVDLTAREQEYGGDITATGPLDLIKQTRDKRYLSNLNIQYCRETTRIYSRDVPEWVWRRAERAFNREVRPALWLSLWLPRLPDRLVRFFINDQRGTQPGWDRAVRAFGRAASLVFWR